MWAPSTVPRLTEVVEQTLELPGGFRSNALFFPGRLGRQRQDPANKTTRSKKLDAFINHLGSLLRITTPVFSNIAGWKIPTMNESTYFLFGNPVDFQPAMLVKTRGFLANKSWGDQVIEEVSAVVGSHEMLSGYTSYTLLALRGQLNLGPKRSSYVGWWRERWTAVKPLKRKKSWKRTKFPLTFGVAGWLTAENLTWIPKLTVWVRYFLSKSSLFEDLNGKFHGNVQEVQQEIFKKRTQIRQDVAMRKGC